jgi:hypothetical protein
MRQKIDSAELYADAVAAMARSLDGQLSVPAISP